MCPIFHAYVQKKGNLLEVVFKCDWHFKYGGSCVFLVDSNWGCYQIVDYKLVKVV